MRRGLLAVGLVIAVMAALVSVPAFLGLALGHTSTGPDNPFPSTAARLSSPSVEPPLAPVTFQSADGYRLSLPGGWTASAMDPLQEELLLSVLRNSDSQVAGLIDSILKATGGDISMVGGDIRGISSSPIPPNVSVLTHPAGTDTLTTAAARISSLLSSVEGVTTPLVAADSTLGGASARRLDWTLRQHTAGTQGAAPAATLTTYVVVAQDRVVVVTLGADSAALNTTRPFLEAIVASFHFEASTTRH